MSIQCPAVIQRCPWVLGRQAPLKWTMKMNSRILKGIHIAAAIGCLLIGLSSLSDGSLISGLCFLSVCVVIALGLTLLVHIQDCKKEAMMHVMLGMFVHGFNGYAIALSGDELYRHRGLAMNAIMFRFIIALFAFPRTMSSFFLISCTINDVGAYLLVDSVHETVTPPRVYFTLMVWNVLFVPVLQLTANRFRMLYDAQELLNLDKRLLQRMLSMLCDGTLTVAEDGDTVLNSSDAMDLLMSTPMTGETLMKFICGDERDDERNRVKQAFQRANTECVLLPTTLIAESMAALNVELIIVYRGSTNESDYLKGMSGYLVGVRLVPVQSNADIDIEEPTGWCVDGGDATEHEAENCSDDQTGLSHPSTAYTGDLFRNLRQGLTESDASRTMSDRVHQGLQELIMLGRREHWLIDMADVNTKPEVLGQGGFGTVMVADMYGMDVAVKVASSPSLNSNVKALLSLFNELRVLRHVRHPNLVLFHGAIIKVATGAFALVLERVYGEELKDFLASYNTSPENMHARLQVITQVCCALWYLHARKPQIIHGDLKESNVLIEHRSRGPHAKLLDFGLSRLMTRDVEPLGGTISWMPPEVINNLHSRPQASADVFSFGRLVYFIATGIKPLARINRQRIINMAKAGNVPPIDWPSAVPAFEPGKAICNQCWVIEASLRPDIARIHTEIEDWSALVKLQMQDASKGNSESSVPRSWKKMSDDRGTGNVEEDRQAKPFNKGDTTMKSTITGQTRQVANDGKKPVQASSPECKEQITNCRPEQRLSL